MDLIATRKLNGCQFQYAERRCSECHIFIVILSVIMLMLTVPTPIFCRGINDKVKKVFLRYFQIGYSLRKVLDTVSGFGF